MPRVSAVRYVSSWKPGRHGTNSSSLTATSTPGAHTAHLRDGKDGRRFHLHHRDTGRLMSLDGASRLPKRLHQWSTLVRAPDWHRTLPRFVAGGR